MAKKQRKPIVPAVGRQAPTAVDPVTTLREAVHLLRRGSYAVVQQQVLRILGLKLDPELRAAATEVLAEAHFRAAMSSDDASEQVKRLDAALELTPKAAKLHFHLGLALWREGRFAEASNALDAAAALEPGRQGLAYLRSLAYIATGKAWNQAGLTPAEANTLRIVASLVRPGPGEKSVKVEEPLLGIGTDLWRALIAMRADKTAAPLNEINAAIDKNTRKAVNRILLYFKGVAALRAGDRGAASVAWRNAQNAGCENPVLGENLTMLLLEDAFALIGEERWQEALKVIGSLPVAETGVGRVVAETASFAHQHLGMEAALAGKWPAATDHWQTANDLTPNRYLAQNLAVAAEGMEKWGEAAEQWRSMVRRKPRKADHPDFLTDLELAALWSHAAECYDHEDDTWDAEECLRNALKYAPDDNSLRLRLADALSDISMFVGAEEVLDEALVKEPQNIEALMRLASLTSGRPDHKAMDLYRRVLAIDPGRLEARDGLADEYADEIIENLWFDTDLALSFFPHKSSSKKLTSAARARELEWIESGLRELPGHPRLLLALGMVHSRSHCFEEARQALLRAYEAAPQQVAIVASVLHELLRVEAGDAVRDLLPAVRKIPQLLPAFWLDQAKSLLDSKLGEEWALVFIDEGLKLSSEPWVDDTYAGLLLQAYEVAAESAATGLCTLLEKRIRDEVPATGAVEFLEAYRAHNENHDKDKATKLMRSAVNAARRVNDTGVLRRAVAMESLLSGFFPGHGPLDILNHYNPYDSF